jgi:hypothetical protein
MRRSIQVFNRYRVKRIYPGIQLPIGKTPVPTTHVEDRMIALVPLSISLFNASDLAGEQNVVMNVTSYLDMFVAKWTDVWNNGKKYKETKDQRLALDVIAKELYSIGDDIQTTYSVFSSTPTAGKLDALALILNTASINPTPITEPKTGQLKHAHCTRHQYSNLTSLLGSLQKFLV